MDVGPLGFSMRSRRLTQIISLPMGLVRLSNCRNYAIALTRGNTANFPSPSACRRETHMAGWS